MSDREELMTKFVELTAASLDEAKFYLEANQDNLQSALSSYYGNDAEDDEDDIADNYASNIHNSVKEVDQSINNMNVATKSNKSKKDLEPKSNVATLSSLKHNESDEEDKRSQAFYVGGSEHGGGQEVLGPPKDGKKPKRRDLNALFKSAQTHGAEIVTKEEDESLLNNKPFSGSGYRLGDNLAESAVPVNAHSSKQSGPQPIKVNVKIWSNGFSINDGPLRSTNEPEDLEFIRALSVGQIPKELLQEHKYSKIDLNMEDHSEEEYKEPPKPKVVPFQGSGMMLGSPTPKMVTQSEVTVNEVLISPVIVNNDEPVTQIQIRLADNSRIVARLNYSHTVGDIRRHIISLHPQYRSISFTLMTTFPNKCLSDDSMTLEEGKLINAVVVQRLC